jgi:hypothetical protein
MSLSIPLPVTSPDSNPHLRDSYLPQVRSRARVWESLRRLVLIAAVLTVLLNPTSLTNARSLAITFTITLAYSCGLWFVNGFGVDWLHTRIPWAEQPGRRLLATLALAVGGSVLVILLIQAVYLLANGQSLALLWRPEMYVQVMVPLAITLIISLFNHSRAFFMSWREAAVRAERLEKETAVARLDSLRRQVDPHFLFNSLNALTALVEEQDPARAVRFIRQLSQVYRYVLDSESQEVVPLRDEIAFAESYVFLQKTRLGDALQVEMDVPAAALSTFFVPPLALQLLLENAIKHNTAYQAEPLQIRVTLDAAAGTLTVRNTRRPRRLTPGEASGRGLQNLKARYAFLTSQPLQIGEENGEFAVTLPLVSF